MAAPVLEATERNIQRAAQRIREGGVVVAPSDTNLALTLDPWNPSAIDRAYEIKGRSPSKPLTLFVRDPADWRRFGSHPDEAVVEALVEDFWPGPLNLVLERTERVPDERLCLDSTVAIGCLANPTWRRLVAAVDHPVAMTSANEAGGADDRLVDLELAREQVGQEVDCLLEGGPRGTTASSTILDLTGEPSILRQGDVRPAALAATADLDLA